MEKGTLYVVATPIGNLGDMSPRAIDVLSGVDLIAAEDTRHSAPLLRHFGIVTACTALHEHNEREQCARLVARLQVGESVALISDAGTPLLSDPGYHLVAAVGAAGLPVVAVPGPSALVAALSVAGLPTDRFVFEGFLPSKAGARRARLAALVKEDRTLVFYEAPHRIEDTLEDMAEVLGAERQAALCRELTKRHETVLREPLGALRERVAGDADQRRGELVLVVAGAVQSDAEETDIDALLGILLEELPVKQAAHLAARISGAKRNAAYRRALALVGQGK
ncbi:MAG TPA: 16S rRNA (cytidine(1402)-2'-O)-methyltransferase [Gammaproteobacteria bacterium]|nr:16S rRNA (cytidine(1402)-2'-O)-methyltransferase [Gammaproteobacteria bacterium]